MKTPSDAVNAYGQFTGRRSSDRKSLVVLVGTLFTAISLVAGIWWGLSSALSQAGNMASSGVSTIPTAPSANTNTSVSPSASMAKGESVVTQPRFVRPAPVFDPVEALALQASLTAGTPTSVQPNANPGTQANKARVVAGAAPLPPAIEPAGWQGTGSALAQMWDLGVQPNFVARAVPLSPRNWRVSGVVQRGEQTQAIVQFEGEPTPRFFKIGDTLPGGAKLAWVQPNVIGVVMPKAGVLAVPVLGGQAPEKSQSKKP